MLKIEKLSNKLIIQEMFYISNMEYISHPKYVNYEATADGDIRHRRLKNSNW